MALADPKWVFGKDTTQAIVGGLVRGARGALREFAEAYATELGLWPALVVTGGDAKLVAAGCDFIDSLVPDLTLMGVALAYSRRLDESEKAIRHAIRLQGDSVAGYHALLRVLMHENRKLPEAKAAAQKLVTVEPTARNYVLLSNLCGKTGDGAGALAAMKRASQLAPGNAEIDRVYKTLKERR